MVCFLNKPGYALSGNFGNPISAAGKNFVKNTNFLNTIVQVLCSWKAGLHETRNLWTIMSIKFSTV